MADISQSRSAFAPPVIDGITGLEVIGRGGFGTVYRGRQEEFKRTVAVKVLDASADENDVRRRFGHEIAAMGAVSHHPHMVAVYAAGTTADRRPFLVMPYLPGGSLAERIEQGPVPWPEAVSLGTRLAGALAAAHSVGVLHRDVKPGNIMFSSYGEPQLADFGIARIAGSTRTATGLVTATVTYAPPEILRADGRPGV
ncbi:MAG: serine/threonine-protein kinase [Acidimicrobiales bacterium]